MKSRPIFLSLIVLPVLSLGSVSCSSLKTAQARYETWKQERELRREEKALAKAEKKDESKEKAPDKPVEAAGDSIFLNYNNPELASNAGSAGAGGFSVTSDFSGLELPVFSENADAGEHGPQGSPIFHADITPVAAVSAASTVVSPAPVLSPELIQAWAASLSPVAGASLTEPLITAAMRAVPETEGQSASAEEEIDPDRANLAAAFAGRPVQTSARPLTSENEHLPPLTNSQAAQF